MSFYHDESGIPFGLPHDTTSQPYHPSVDNDQTQSAPDTETARYCSVRGCTAPLPQEYLHKMCEACRERHRVYASTKRAKRKMEKAALNGQTGVSWMPADGDGGDPGPAVPGPPPSALSDKVQVASSSQHTTTYEFAEETLEHERMDIDRLFPPIMTYSELASALGYATEVPSTHFSPSSGAQPNTPVPDSGAASSSNSSFAFIPSTSTPIVPPVAPASTEAKGEISVRSISEVASQGGSALPPRYCSIKGCKTVVDGGSLFKMCDSCRTKYKGYGTTKRKKWKEEKTKALAELERQREQENKMRADNGLPPLSPNERLAWLDGEIGGLRVVNTSIPRMCTVSHCREILAVGYQYLRCERHRIQNRHHSKLKRFRDKSSKAQALEEWYATVADDMPDTTLVHTPRERRSQSDDLFGDEDAEQDEGDDSPAFEFHGPEEHRDAVAHDINMVEPQVIVFGVPPAARGVRRTNHSCSVKGCFNLLSPTTPWKMCDQCRAHERGVRKVRAMRESGIDVEPIPPRWFREKREPKVKVKQSAKKTGKQKEINREASESPSRSVSRDRTTEASSTEREGSVIVFMDPILPDEHPPAIDRTTAHSSSFAVTDGAGNVTAPPEGPQTTPVAQAPVAESSTNNGVEQESAGKKKGRKKKGAEASSACEATAGAAGSSVNGASASASIPASTPAPHVPFPPPTSGPGAPPLPQPYAVPYYPPAPYATPYFQGAPYPYAPPPPPPFARDGFTPSPMYQPPFPGYSMYPPYPYPYYHPSYGQHPYAPPPPGMIIGPPPADTSANASEAASQPALHFAQMPPPPPPPDPSTMYGVFSARTPARKASNNSVTSAAASDPPPENSAPPLMITAAPGKEPVYSQIIAGEAPMRRKRRKADYEAVAAFQKRRQEESIAKAQASTSNVSSALPPPVMPVSRAPEVPQPETPMDIDSETVVPTTSDLAESNDQQLLRPCAGKACHRTLSPSDTSSICSRCKDRIKKHALKVKKRFKLVPTATHIPAAKKTSPSSDADVLNDADAQQPMSC